MYHFNASQTAAADLQLASQKPAVEVAASVSRFLKPFQTDAVRFLYNLLSRNERCILNDESGLGKSVVAAVLLSAIYQTHPQRKTLIVVQNDESTIDGWRFHLHVVARELRVTAINDEQDYARGEHDIYIVQWGTLRLLGELNLRFDFVIVDNRGQMLENAFCVSLLLKKFERRVDLFISSVDITSDLKLMHNALRLVGRLSAQHLCSFKNFEEKFQLPDYKNISERRANLEDYFQKRGLLVDYCKHFRLRRNRYEFESLLPLVHPQTYKKNIEVWRQQSRNESLSQKSRYTNDNFYTYSPMAKKVDTPKRKRVSFLDERPIMHVERCESEPLSDSDEPVIMSPLIFISDTELDLEEEAESNQTRKLKANDILLIPYFSPSRMDSNGLTDFHRQEESPSSPKKLTRKRRTQRSAEYLSEALKHVESAMTPQRNEENATTEGKSVNRIWSARRRGEMLRNLAQAGLKTAENGHRVKEKAAAKVGDAPQTPLVTPSPAQAQESEKTPAAAEEKATRPPVRRDSISRDKGRGRLFMSLAQARLRAATLKSQGRTEQSGTSLEKATPAKGEAAKAPPMEETPLNTNRSEETTVATQKASNPTMVASAIHEGTTQMLPTAVPAGKGNTTEETEGKTTEKSKQKDSMATTTEETSREDRTEAAEPSSADALWEQLWSERIPHNTPQPEPEVNQPDGTQNGEKGEVSTVVDRAIEENREPTPQKDTQRREEGENQSNAVKDAAVTPKRRPGRPKRSETSLIAGNKMAEKRPGPRTLRARTTRQESRRLSDQNKTNKRAEKAKGAKEIQEIPPKVLKNSNKTEDKPTIKDRKTLKGTEKPAEPSTAAEETSSQVGVTPAKRQKRKTKNNKAMETHALKETRSMARETRSAAAKAKGEGQRTLEDILKQRRKQNGQRRRRKAGLLPKTECEEEAPMQEAPPKENETAKPPSIEKSTQNSLISNSSDYADMQCGQKLVLSPISDSVGDPSAVQTPPQHELPPAFAISPSPLLFDPSPEIEFVSEELLNSEPVIAISSSSSETEEVVAAEAPLPAAHSRRTKALKKKPVVLIPSGVARILNGTAHGRTFDEVIAQHAMPSRRPSKFLSPDLFSTCSELGITCTQKQLALLNSRPFEGFSLFDSGVKQLQQKHALTNAAQTVRSPKRDRSCLDLLERMFDQPETQQTGVSDADSTLPRTPTQTPQRRLSIVPVLPPDQITPMQPIGDLGLKTPQKRRSNISSHSAAPIGAVTPPSSPKSPKKVTPPHQRARNGNGPKASGSNGEPSTTTTPRKATKLRPTQATTLARWLVKKGAERDPETPKSPQPHYIEVAGHRIRRSVVKCRRLDLSMIQ